MAVKVKVGDIYTEIKRGTSARGSYGIATAKAEKGSDKISIFFSNPNDISDDTYAIEVEEILDASVTAKQIDGKWFKNYSVTAKVKPVEGGAVATEITDDGLPF